MFGPLIFPTNLHFSIHAHCIYSTVGHVLLQENGLAVAGLLASLSGQAPLAIA